LAAGAGISTISVGKPAATATATASDYERRAVRSSSTCPETPTSTTRHKSEPGSCAT